MGGLFLVILNVSTSYFVRLDGDHFFWQQPWLIIYSVGGDLHCAGGGHGHLN